MSELVLVRAMFDQPLVRIVVDRKGGYVRVANPSLIDAVEVGLSHPIAFPSSDVFVLDSIRYEGLLAQWTKQDFSSLRESWSECELFT